MRKRFVLIGILLCILLCCCAACGKKQETEEVFISSHMQEQGLLPSEILSDNAARILLRSEEEAVKEEQTTQEETETEGEHLRERTAEEQPQQMDYRSQEMTQPEATQADDWDWEDNGGDWTDSGNDDVSDPWHYADATCDISVQKIWYADSWCYCAHVLLSDYSRFGSASANGWYGSGTESTYQAGNRLGAILCINGDYACQNAEPHAAIRRGVVEAYGDKKTYVPEAYNANTGILFNAFEGYCFPETDIRCSSHTIQESANEGLITDTFIFGPAGLNDGYVGGSNSGSKRPRTLLGTTGIPGELWMVVTAGDYSDGVSPGLTGYEGAALLRDLGCTFGGHLDGGGSSAMYFMGEMLVANEGWEGRYVADFAYVR